jgi:hypothetical protein
MSTPSNDPPKSFTAQDIQAWLCAATEKRAALHIQAASPWHSNARHEAFTAMSDLLQEALEEVRVLSASLQEASQAVRAQAADLQAHSTKLMERGATVMAHMAQFLPSLPEQVQQAERPLVEKFKGGHNPADS